MKLRPLGVYAFLYLAFLYVPVLLLPIFSFNDSSIVAFPLKGFTSLWYAELWHIDTLHGALWNSLEVAISCSGIANVLGFCGAPALTRYHFPPQALVAGVPRMRCVL